MGEPVSDWATDYDVLDPGYVANPFPVWDDLRDRCPVAHTPRWGGSWMPTTYEHVTAIAHDIEHFSSIRVAVIPPQIDPDTGLTQQDLLPGGLPPISADPPLHTWTRRLLLPWFSPARVAEYEPYTRELCQRLVAGFADAGRADAAADYAQQIPVRVIATMLGVPVEMSDEFTSWVRGVLEIGLTDPKVRLENRINIISFFKQQLEDRKANPRENDLITDLLNSGDKYPVTDQYVLGVCNLMLVAGIDTTWSAIGSSLWHLAQHPEHRRQLRDNPGLWPTAVEELLRAYSPVTMARIVDRDIEFQGCPMKAGDRILMAFPAANRDPRQFENPNEVILDREHNRHVAFGSGIHRCAGSNLARLELRVALQTWLERIPEFSLADPASVTWAGGQVHGPRVCRVRFSA
ncbi:MAG: cytochrome P450 [Phycisphaerales bacterium]